MAENARTLLEATLTCPQCGHAQRAAMPVDYCLYFYTCRGCEALLRPLQGDCCVFCSYADVACPPKQLRSRRPLT
ncbi:MAG TPA: GDCCVxC domain-containing (seleno)protein [Gammaproteobacteria bacterium]|nr:GDCCVxC domain-containing (seleno)protein [Gammaproteobacteria bacterium]